MSVEVVLSAQEVSHSYRTPRRRSSSCSARRRSRRSSSFETDRNQNMMTLDVPEQISSKRRSRSRSPLGEAADTFVDAASKAIKNLENSFKKITHQESIPEPPGNNVHLRHPGMQDFLSFGLHIEEHPYGCCVSRVIENGLASNSKLQDGDIITDVNGAPLKGFDLGRVISCFSSIDLSQTLTLVIHRAKKDENGDDIVQVIQVKIVITVTDEQIACTAEILVTATYLRYSSDTASKYIQYAPAGKSPRYLRVDNGENVSLSTSIDGKSIFKMEMYQGVSPRVCVVRNTHSSKVLDNVTRDEIEAVNAKGPSTSQTVSNPDKKYFHWYSHPDAVGCHVFESLSRNKHFLVVTSDHKLELQHFSSADRVPSRGQFKVINAH